jgi:hypothetical protein
MPSGKNWINFLYVNVFFIIFIICVFYYIRIENIRTNWPLYRCNPLYMLLADDIYDNFNFCVRKSNHNYLSYVFFPFIYISNLLSNKLNI